MKELKEDLLSRITSLINEQNRQIENLNDKLTKQNSIILVLQNNVEDRNYGRILIPNVTSWNNTLDVNVFGLKELSKQVEDVINLVKDSLLKPMLAFQILY